MYFVNNEIVVHKLFILNNSLHFVNMFKKITIKIFKKVYMRK